jgi:hypothetical protein
MQLTIDTDELFQKVYMRKQNMKRLRQSNPTAAEEWCIMYSEDLELLFFLSPSLGEQYKAWEREQK